MSIAPPEVVSSPGDYYVLSWKDPGIQAEISHLYDKWDGTSAEIHFTKGGGHLHRARLNLLSTSGKKALSAEMSSRLNNLDWRIIIEQLSDKTLELYRQGEPLEELWTSEDIEAPQYLLKPLIYRGLPTIVFGEKAASKSTLTLLIYACLILPWSDNPIGFDTPARSTIPLILDWETERDVTHWNAKRLQNGMGLPAFPVYYRRCRLPLHEDVEQIQKYIAKVGAKVLIIDSLGQAAGGELNKPEVALTFFSALRRLKTTALIIAQTSKDIDSKRKTIFGSTYFQYYARSIFELCKSTDDSGDEISVALFHRFCNISRLHDPIGLRIAFTDSTISIERQAVTPGEFIEKYSTQKAIIELLMRGARKTKDIADDLGVSESAVKMAIKRLKDKGKVVLTENGYGLLSTSL